MRTVLPLLLLFACGGGDTAVESEESEYFGTPGWSECQRYSATAEVTCDEVCADEGLLCLEGGCDGDTLMGYADDRCGYESRGDDVSCSEEVRVATSTRASMACCGW